MSNETTITRVCNDCREDVPVTMLRRGAGGRCVCWWCVDRARRLAELPATPRVVSALSVVGDIIARERAL